VERVLLKPSELEERIKEISCFYEGDNPVQGHYVRDNPPTRSVPPRERFDVVVVGGGISGLTAAYGLKDKHVLVLEKDRSAGGSAKMKEWSGIKYTLGPTNIRLGYDVELNGKRFDFLTPFFDEVGVRWSKIREPTDALFIKGKLVRNIFGEGVDDLPFSNGRKEKFKEAWGHLETLVKGPGSPVIPIEANGVRALKLDRKSLGDILDRFGPDVGAVIDLMSRSIFGAGSHELSAFAALTYLRGEFSDQYGAPGGTAILAERLQSTMRDCVRTRCIVAGIEQDSSSAYVTYLDEDHRPVTVGCKAVIYAASKHVAHRIFRDLPAKKVNALQRMKFDAYFVANLFCDSTVYDDSFGVYFEDAIFTDLAVNNWLKKGDNKSGKQVLSLFCPRGVNGRHELLSKPFRYWLPKILGDLEKYIPGSAARIRGVEICRYGHHYAIPYPGFITGDRKIIKKRYRRYLFAKDDTQGVPSLESAIWSGMKAAEEARQRLR
jgi:protoporphyrinogen oxidase